MPSKLTPEQVEQIFALKEESPCATSKDVSIKVGCAEVTVRRYWEGVRKRGRIDEAKRELIRKLYREGMLIAGIMRTAHASTDTIKEAVKGLPKRQADRRKLSDDEKADIRARYVQGEKVAAIAASYGITEGRVNLVTDGLPRRDNRGKFMTINMTRCVIVEMHGEPAAFMIQPTGRAEFCASAFAVERQWHLEAVDTRDGRIKMFPIADLHKWVQPVANRPDIAGKIMQKGA